MAEKIIPFDPHEPPKRPKANIIPVDFHEAPPEPPEEVDWHALLSLDQKKLQGILLWLSKKEDGEDQV